MRVYWVYVYVSRMQIETLQSDLRAASQQARETVRLIGTPDVCFCAWNWIGRIRASECQLLLCAHSSLSYVMPCVQKDELARVSSEKRQLEIVSTQSLVSVHPLAIGRH